MTKSKENVDLYKYENEGYEQGFKLICGVDEVGRGPLVGPVVAAAVILPKDFILEGLNDSKKLSKKQRELFYEIIKEKAIAYQVSFVSEKVIDEINIYQASKKAMIIAIGNLKVKPDYVLIDAMPINELSINNLSIIKGDSKSISIAAASVIAKVERDKYMLNLADEYPMYGYDTHMGYPTKKHIEAIEKFGITEHYRKTYKPIKNIISAKK